MTSVAKVLCAAPIGFNGSIIEVESHTSRGLPGLQIVGMGNKAIDEARERVRSATANSLLEFPSQKIIINLAPAELPKDGTHYDVAIALAILISSGQLRQAEVDDAIFAGELALDGNIRPIKGAVSITETAQRANIKTIYLPTANVRQAALIPDVTIIGISSLRELFLHLKKELILTTPHQPKPLTQPTTKGPVLDDVQGQEQAKRALVIAAAGRHNILLSGPPGSGKTMLARTLTSLLPPLSPTEQIAVTKLHSLTNEATGHIIHNRPFRAPHHTTSRTALIGGGSKPKPGEISLAHLGVLFLDEIPEYPRSFLEALRQPLEDKQIAVSRASGQVLYPADFMMVATMNPCPCGYSGDTTRECSCNSSQILAYQKRLSGPLLDRIDMILTVSRVPNEDLLKQSSSLRTQHDQALKSILSARSIQQNRYRDSTKYNSNLNSPEIKSTLDLTPAVHNILRKAADRLQLSARSYFKVIKVAQTIADLEAAPIRVEHVAEALQYRQNY